MIAIDLLRHQKKTAFRLPEIPWKPVAAGLCILAACAVIYFLRGLLTSPPRAGIERKNQIAPLKGELASFDMAEDIADGIRGGRVKVRALSRRSPPVRLPADEKRIFERFFVKNAFDVFNACIRPGMGFNTITLDNRGNFFIYGVSREAAEVHGFRECLTGQESVLQADTPDFKSSFGNSRLRFVLKGFLSFSIIDRFTGDDTLKVKETLPASRKTVLADMVRIGKRHGITVFRRIEWGASEEYGGGRKHTLRIQVECSYGAFMQWVKAMAEQDCQIGYSRVSLTSMGKERILAVMEMAVYSGN
jgi:hypothetical protein